MALSSEHAAEQTAGRGAREPRRSLGLFDQVDRARRDDDQERLAQDGRRHDVEQLGQSSFAGRPHDGELLEKLVQELDRSRALPDARGRAGPAQDEPAPLVPAGLQAERRRERDRLLDGFPLLGGRLGARQPRIDQDRQVLLVLLLELLDHQLAAAGRRPPVDPPRAVARAVIAQPMVFHLLRRTVMPLARAGSRSPGAASETSAGSDGRSWDRPRSGRAARS